MLKHYRSLVGLPWGPDVDLRAPELAKVIHTKSLMPIIRLKCSEYSLDPSTFCQHKTGVTRTHGLEENCSRLRSLQQILCIFRLTPAGIASDDKTQQSGSAGTNNYLGNQLLPRSVQSGLQLGKQTRHKSSFRAFFAMSRMQLRGRLPLLSCCLSPLFGLAYSHCEAGQNRRQVLYWRDAHKNCPGGTPTSVLCSVYFRIEILYPVKCRQYRKTRQGLGS